MVCFADLHGVGACGNAFDGILSGIALDSHGVICRCTAFCIKLDGDFIGIAMEAGYCFLKIPCFIVFPPLIGFCIQAGRRTILALTAFLAPASHIKITLLALGAMVSSFGSALLTENCTKLGRTLLVILRAIHTQAALLTP